MSPLFCNGCAELVVTVLMLGFAVTLEITLEES